MKSEHSKEYQKSIIFLHVSVMLFGLSAVLGQYADVPAVAVAGGRVICSSLLLLLISWKTGSAFKLNSKSDYGIVGFTGLILAIHWTTFFQSIQSSSVAIGTITFSTFPLFLTFLEPMVFRERISVRNLIISAILLLGVMITVPEFSIENQTTIGIIWGMISSLAYAIMSLTNRHLSQKYPSKTICLYEQGTAAMVLLPFMVFTEIHWSIQNLVSIGAIGFICTALAHTLYISAQKKVKAQTAGIISGMETVYGILYAFLFLREVPTPRELVGGTIILCTAVFSSFSTSETVKKNN